MSGLQQFPDPTDRRPEGDNMITESRYQAIRFPWVVLRHYPLSFVALLISACASAPKVLPVESTYPVGQTFATTSTLRLGLPVYSSESTLKSSTHPSIDEEIRYSPGQTVLSRSFTGTTRGDKAARDVWITPDGRGRSDEKSLLDQIDAKGREACGSDYRHLDTKYYYGSEATLQLLQIKTPALHVEYRCRAARYEIATNDGALLEQWAANEDSPFFDLSVYDVPTPPSVMVDALKAYAGVNGWVLEDGPTLPADGMPRLFSMTSRTRRPTNVAFFERAYVAIADTGSSTRMTLLFMHYRTAGHARGVELANTARPGFEWGMRPSLRDFTFYRSGLFVEGVLERAKKG